VVQWVLTDRLTGDLVDAIDASPTAGGLVDDVWTVGVAADLKLELVATDASGHVGSSYVTFESKDPHGLDQDGDGVTPAAGTATTTTPPSPPTRTRSAPT
jgi:hypothetical protein